MWIPESTYSYPNFSYLLFCPRPQLLQVLSANLTMVIPKATSRLKADAHHSFGKKFLNFISQFCSWKPVVISLSSQTPSLRDHKDFLQPYFPHLIPVIQPLTTTRISCENNSWPGQHNRCMTTNNNKMKGTTNHWSFIFVNIKGLSADKKTQTSRMVG